MRLFLSAPFTQLLREDRKSDLAAFSASWNSIVERLQAAGHVVYSAHRREAWGAKLDTPEDALMTDLKWLREADLLLAYVGEPPSPGVQLELGYALAIGLRCIIFVEHGRPEPYLLRGIPAVADAEIVEIHDVDEMGAMLMHRDLPEAKAGQPPPSPSPSVPRRLARRKAARQDFASALQLVEDRWTLSIVRELAAGPRRFLELQRALPGISTAQLRTRLNRLVADGQLTRQRFRDVPPRVEYGLTEQTHELMPVLSALARWGYDWEWSQPPRGEEINVTNEEAS